MRSFSPVFLAIALSLFGSTTAIVRDTSGPTHLQHARHVNVQARAVAQKAFNATRDQSAKFMKLSTDIEPHTAELKRLSALLPKANTADRAIHGKKMCACLDLIGNCLGGIFGGLGGGSPPPPDQVLYDAGTPGSTTYTPGTPGTSYYQPGGAGSSTYNPGTVGKPQFNPNGSVKNPGGSSPGGSDPNNPFNPDGTPKNPNGGSPGGSDPNNPYNPDGTPKNPNGGSPGSSTDPNDPNDPNYTGGDVVTVWVTAPGAAPTTIVTVKPGSPGSSTYQPGTPGSTTYTPGTDGTTTYTPGTPGSIDYSSGGGSLGCAGLLSGCLGHITSCLGGVTGVSNVAKFLPDAQRTQMFSSFKSINSQFGKIIADSDKTMPGFSQHIAQLTAHLNPTLGSATSASPLRLNCLKIPAGNSTVPATAANATVAH